MNHIAPVNLEISPGKPYPLGANELQEGVNFAIAAKNAKKLFLCFFQEGKREEEPPLAEIELDPILNKTGDVWHIFIKGLPPFAVYGYRLISDLAQNNSYLLLDPYAKIVASHDSWGSDPLQPYRPLGRTPGPSSFDWQGDKFPKIESSDLILYEVHVRGFTNDPSSAVAHKGTFLGLIEKIPYLKELGINALEIMPIHEFNENENIRINPKTKKKLFNYFGYSTVNYFSPMNRYCSLKENGDPLIEFKTMVRELHKAGIEVILDVVYNHTAEGGISGPLLSFRGFNDHAYYMINEEGDYLNFTGCGNTVHANHPLSQELIINSLRYWVAEMHVDGFRFDLASALTRAGDGTPLNPAPIIEAISLDPVLSETKLIAEAWDSAGLYQVGGFYPGSRWLEWNGRYRDVVRRFIKGTPGQKTRFATAICGSQDLYGWRGTPACSVNFITCHDGFTLSDLVAYNEKHNEENGEDNRDGFDHNDSWNCGKEGPCGNKKTLNLREHQMRNFHFALMISQGVPMIFMGDEYGHTRRGNNNPWCQDNELNWFLWDHQEAHPGFNRFFRSLIQLRKNHPLLRKTSFLTDKDITWHGTAPLKPLWNIDNGLLAFTLNDIEGPSLYIAFNARSDAEPIEIPSAKAGKKWNWVVNTHGVPPNDYFEEKERPELLSPFYSMPAFSALLLEASPE